MGRTKKVAAAATETAATEVQEAKKYTTPEELVDKDGIFMGEEGSQARKEYEKLQKKPNKDKLIKAMKERYVYNPNKAHMNVRIILTCELLAMSPGTQNIYANFIAGHALDAMSREEEVNTLGAQEVTERGRSVFDVINGKIVWPSRRWLGFFKSRFAAQRRDEDSLTTQLSSYKDKLDENISFTAQWFPVKFPKGTSTGICDRTMPGDGFKRPTSIKSSESAPAGTITNFTVQTNLSTTGKKGSTFNYLDALRECLDAGVEYGTGEWRGSGKKGTFVWEELDDEGNVIGGNTLKHIGCTSADPNFKEKFYEYVNARLVGEEDTLEL